MNVLIFGRGWLGQKFYNHFASDKNFRPIISKGDILDIEERKNDILAMRPDVVLNCAGVCGSPNIDWCDETETNKRLTYAVNSYGPRILLDTVRSISDAKFVHLSSGCLWDVPESHHSILETDCPNPPSTYANSKALGEQRISSESDVLIPRLRMPIDSVPHERNLIDKLKQYEYVLSRKNSVTTVETLLRAVTFLLTQDETGIFHITDGETSPTQIMYEYQKRVDPEHHFEEVTMDELVDKGLVKSGRSNCILDNSRLRRRGFVISPIYHTLCRIMEEYRLNLC